VRLLKRNGIDWSDKYPSAIAALKNINARTAYFDGELCGIDEFGSPSFARTQAASDSERGVHVAYYTFDLMHLDRRNLSLSRLIGRKTLLEPRSPRRPIYSSTATSLATARFSARTQENSASSPPHPRLPPTDPERRGLVPYRPAEGHVSRPKDVSRWRTGGRIEIVDLGDSAPSTGVRHNDAGVDREGLAPTVSSFTPHYNVSNSFLRTSFSLSLWETAVFFDDVE
jgi:hypothetical protein